MTFDGENYLPEFEDDYDSDKMKDYLEYKYSNTFKLKINEQEDRHICPDYENYCTHVASGRLVTAEGDKDYAVFFDEHHLYSRHVIVCFA